MSKAGKAILWIAYLLVLAKNWLVDKVKSFF